MIAQRIVAATLAGALAGCTTDNPPQAMGAPPPPVAPAAATAVAPSSAAMASGSVDGAYKGSMAMTRNGGGQCTNPGEITLRVRDRTVRSSFGPTVRLEAKVQPDGTFSTQSGRTTFSGTVQGGRLEAEIGNEYCSYHYSLTRI